MEIGWNMKDFSDSDLFRCAKDFMEDYDRPVTFFAQKIGRILAL